MKYLKKFESIEEIHDSLDDFKHVIDFISVYDKLETYEINDIIDELLKSSKSEILEIYDSCIGNYYDVGYEKEYQKNDFTLEIISKYCQEIWSK